MLCICCTAQHKMEKRKKDNKFVGNASITTIQRNLKLLSLWYPTQYSKIKRAENILHFKLAETGKKIE